MSECEEGRFHLRVLCPGKGFDFTGSACFDFVFSWDIIKFLLPAPEPLLGTWSRPSLSPWAIICPHPVSCLHFLNIKAPSKTVYGDEDVLDCCSVWPRLCHLGTAASTIQKATENLKMPLWLFSLYSKGPILLTWPLICCTLPLPLPKPTRPWSTSQWRRSGGVSTCRRWGRKDCMRLACSQSTSFSDICL